MLDGYKKRLKRFSRYLQRMSEEEILLQLKRLQTEGIERSMKSMGVMMKSGYG